MNNECYCCEKPGIGQGDHVPPRKLFASGTFSSSPPIIVPSCLKHNQSLSQADEYLKLILTASTAGVPQGVRDSTIRSIVRNTKNPNANLTRYGIRRTEGGLKVSSTFPVDAVLLEDALSKVARGIYYHHYRGAKKLIGEVSVFPIFLGVATDAPIEARRDLQHLEAIVAECLEVDEIHGDHPDVFSYQVLETTATITVNMVFYRTHIASVIKTLFA